MIINKFYYLISLNIKIYQITVYKIKVKSNISKKMIKVIYFHINYKTNRKNNKLLTNKYLIMNILLYLLMKHKKI